VDVELRDLRWAVVASQHRSLRQAAEALNVRQSTLSRRLRFIEDRLGVELFLRSNGGTHATVAGLEFLDTARRILEDTTTAFRKLKARSRGEAGQLTLGVYASLTTGNMQATLAEHHRRYPEVDVHIVDGGHDRLFGALMAKAVDIAIMTRNWPSWDDRCLPLWSERVVAAIRDDHPLRQCAAIQWSALAGERIMLASQGPGPEVPSGPAQASIVPRSRCRPVAEPRQHGARDIAHPRRCDRSTM
jgi:DNA-binding transcriptional LysR family regulator